MSRTIGECLLFDKPGPGNTRDVLEAVLRTVVTTGIDTVVVPSCTGETAFMAREILGDKARIITVTHVTGFVEPNLQEMDLTTRRKLEGMGVTVYTGQHAFGGVGRAVRRKLGTYELEEIIAYTLRVFGQGTKVAIEITLMVADAGLVRTDKDVIALGGTESGVDTALILKPANSFNFFDLKVREFICKPCDF
ncbi:MAG: hypothetical protein N2317_07475 [Syntrophales bacterium]|nr:hypothetical protein [Syntrophales bacterium]